MKKIVALVLATVFSMHSVFAQQELDLTKYEPTITIEEIESIFTYEVASTAPEALEVVEELATVELPEVKEEDPFVAGLPEYAGEEEDTNDSSKWQAFKEKTVNVWSKVKAKWSDIYSSEVQKAEELEAFEKEVPG